MSDFYGSCTLKLQGTDYDPNTFKSVVFQYQSECLLCGGMGFLLGNCTAEPCIHCKGTGVTNG